MYRPETKELFVNPAQGAATETDRGCGVPDPPAVVERCIEETEALFLGKVLQLVVKFAEQLLQVDLFTVQVELFLVGPGLFQEVLDDLRHLPDLFQVALADLPEFFGPRCTFTELDKDADGLLSRISTVFREPKPAE